MLHFQPCQLSDTGTRGLCPGWQLAVPRPGRLRRGLGLLLLPVQPGPSQTWYRSSIPFRRRLTHRGNVEREGGAAGETEAAEPTETLSPSAWFPEVYPHAQVPQMQRTKRAHLCVCVQETSNKFGAKFQLVIFSNILD